MREQDNEVMVNTYKGRKVMETRSLRHGCNLVREKNDMNGHDIVRKGNDRSEIIKSWL